MTRSATAPKLDRLDRRILAQLQRNGRMSNVELADAVGLSPSPCLKRVKRLERSGHIAGYGAQLRLDRIGESLTTFTEVFLADHRREDFARFEASAELYPEIMECHRVSGKFDYVLKLVTRDVEHYESVMEDLLVRNEGIEKYRSFVVVKSVVTKTVSSVQQSFLTSEPRTA